MATVGIKGLIKQTVETVDQAQHKSVTQKFWKVKIYCQLALYTTK